MKGFINFIREQGVVGLAVGFILGGAISKVVSAIVNDLVKNKELNLHIRPDGSTKYNNSPDFKFVVLEKFLSIENEFALKEGILLNSYFLLKKLGLSDEKAFGLEKSDVVVEQVPLIYHPITNIQLQRNEKH